MKSSAYSDFPKMPVNWYLPIVIELWQIGMNVALEPVRLTRTSLKEAKRISFLIVQLSPSEPRFYGFSSQWCFWYYILYTIYNIYNSICSNSSSSFKYQKAATISRAINIIYQRWFLVWNEMRKADRAIEFDLSRPVKYLDFSLKLVITFYKTRSPYSPSILFRPSFLYSLELETLYLTVDWISSLYKRSIDWTNEQFEE